MIHLLCYHFHLQKLKLKNIIHYIPNIYTNENINLVSRCVDKLLAIALVTFGNSEISKYIV